VQLECVGGLSAACWSFPHYVWLHLSESLTHPPHQLFLLTGVVANVLVELPKQAGGEGGTDKGGADHDRNNGKREVRGCSKCRAPFI